MAKTTAVKDIIAIVPDVSYSDPLQRVSVASIRTINNSDPTNEYPRNYALINNNEESFTIELDYTPEQDYDLEDYPASRLLVHYYPNFRIMGDNSEFDEFLDYTEDNMQAGKWKLPSDWHRLIVEGAIAILYPELRQQWLLDCERKNRTRFTNSKLKLKSHLGVTNNNLSR